MNDQSSSKHWELVIENIRHGRCAEIPHWISSEAASTLRNQVMRLYTEGYFVPSGLRRSPSDNGYGTEDRLICEEWPDPFVSEEIVQVMEELDSLRRFFAQRLCRTSMMLDSLDHESYLSLSFEGAYLALHMDERHEELRPSNRYLTSVSLPFLE